MAVRHALVAAFAVLIVTPIGADSEVSAVDTVVHEHEPAASVDPLRLDEDAGLSKETIMKTIKKAVKEELEVPHRQWFNALLAFAVGAVLIHDSDKALKYFVVFSAFILAMLVAYHDISAEWGLDYSSPIRHIVGWEAGAVGAYAVFRGYEGVMLAIGAGFGAFLAQEGRSFFIKYGQDTMESNKWIIVCWYTVFILGCTAAVAKNKHAKVLAVLTVALGSAFIVSAVSWFFTYLAMSGSMDFLNNMLPGLDEPKEGAWVDFFLLLWGKGEDVGIFATSTYNPEFASMDRIIGCVCWLILFVLAALRQFRVIAMKASMIGYEGNLKEPLVAKV